MEARHVPALDGVRGLAALLVLVTHAWPSPVTYFGWTGVDLFFVLSGYLITGILLDTRDRAGRVKDFYIRRILRILPLYYGVLFGCFVVLPLVHPLATEEYRRLVHVQAWYWTYLSNWAYALIWPLTPTPIDHLWSLANEEQFYLLWPFIVWRVSPRRLLWVAVGAMLGALALRAALLTMGASPRTPYLLTPCRLDGLAVGAILAIVARRPGGSTAVRGRIRLAVGAAIGVLVAVLASQLARGVTLFELDPAMQIIGYPAIAVGFGGLLVASLGRWNQAFSIAPLRWLGRYSYGLYVYHPLVILALRRKTSLHIRTLEFFVVASVLSVLAAWVSYRGYEQWFLRLKKRWTPRVVPNYL